MRTGPILLLTGFAVLAGIGVYAAYRYSENQLEFNPDSPTPIVVLKRNWLQEIQDLI